MDKAQETKLNDLIKNLQKKHGVESIQLFGKSIVSVNWVPLDSFYLTKLLGNGYPRGRMIEIYGPESTGKTSLACYLGGQCQKHYFEDKERYGVVAYIDVEHALDPEYARTFGLKSEDMLFSQPDSAEQALNLTEDLIASGLVDMVIIDSVAALTPQAEIDGEMGDSHMGLQARLMSQACRKLQSKMGPKDATVVFINQIRMKIGCVAPETEVEWE